ncbi:MAG: hypothetical protein H7Y05_00545 [Steroidobacteraceae bacterium]|nr:hypothetical protein [Deltaproteobacteria bacterium]
MTRPRQENYKQKLLSEGWTRHDVYLPPGIAGRLKELQEHHRDTSLGEVIARLVQPKVSGADVARELLAQAHGDYDGAAELLLAYMRGKYPGFIASTKEKGPAKQEYDRIRKALDTLRDK